MIVADSEARAEERTTDLRGSMTDRSVYKVKAKDQIVVIMIGLVIAVVAAVAVFFPDTFDPGTAIARTAKRIAPLLMVIGLATAAQPIVRIRRGALTVDQVGIRSPFYWSLARGTVQWSNVKAIESVGAPFGKNRGLYIHVERGRGITVPIDLLESGAHLEEDVRSRFVQFQSSDTTDQ